MSICILNKGYICPGRYGKMIGVTINLFKPVTYKLAMRSFCIPAILTTYAAFFVEAFLLPGVLSPPYPSEGKIIEAINLLVVVGFVEYVMLKRIWDAPKKTTINVHIITYSCLAHIGAFFPLALKHFLNFSKYL